MGQPRTTGLREQPPRKDGSVSTPEFRLATEPLTFEQVLGPPTPHHLRCLLESAENATSDTERQLLLGFATESLEDIEAEANLPSALLTDLRAELLLGRARHHLSQTQLEPARSCLRDALAAAEDGSGDVVLLGHVHETVAQLALLADGPIEADLRLRPAIDLFLDADQQPELGSALFRAAAWRLEAGDREVGLDQVRTALDSLGLDSLLEDGRSGAWAALRRCVGTSERAAGGWAPLHFAVETELAAVGLAEPRRRRVQGEAWALAALTSLARTGDAPGAGAMLTRAELCLLRDTTASRERLRALAGAVRHLVCEPEQLEPVAAELAWVAAVLTAWSERGRSPASLWSRAVTQGETTLSVFDPAKVEG